MTDPVSAAALEVVAMEQRQDELAMSEQEKREVLIAKTHRMMGRIETADIFGKLATVSSLVWLRQVKESKIYRDLPEIGSWEKFCNHLGKSRQLIDEQLRNLSILGDEFLLTCQQFSLGYRDLRKLRMATKDGDLVIDGNNVIIGEETIPISPEHSEDLQAAIETVIEKRDRTIEERDITLRAKDRVLEEKSRIIQKQETDLAKYERRIKERGFAPGEEDFIKECENLKTILVGLELKMDPRNMPGDMTPLMKAAYCETLGHFRRTIDAYYDDATNLYGDATDDDWVPPYERSGD